MIRIACTAINKRINAGKVNKAGTDFIGSSVDVTSDCLKAVIDKIGVGNVEQITADGVPVYEIEIRAASTRTASDTRTAALEEAAKACEAEAVEKTGTIGDSAYNDAINDCAKAIRALSSAAGEAECDAALRPAPASQHDADEAARAWMVAHGYGNQSFGYALADLQSRIEAKDREGAELVRRIVNSDIGRDTLRKLGEGQGTATEDGKAWLEAASRSRAEGGNTQPEPPSYAYGPGKSWVVLQNPMSPRDFAARTQADAGKAPTTTTTKEK